MAHPLQLVFCGTPQFAVPSLELLARDERFHVALVVTQPDRPKGRGLELTASPVNQKAVELDIPITQPSQIKENSEFRTLLEAIKPDAVIVVGYGRIIPAWMLALPRLGNINLHASILPKYRGAAPIQWAIANGETVTGNTTMLINAGLDTGDILLQEETPISPDDTSLTLAPLLAASGAELLAETLIRFDAGIIKPIPQNNVEATLAPILKKDDGRIDFSCSAHQIYNRMRGFTPWPGAFTTFNGHALKITSAHSANSEESAAIGRILSVGELFAHKDKLFVGCGAQTILNILEAQLEGKRRMSARDFINGHHIASGSFFGI